MGEITKKTNKKTKLGSEQCPCPEYIKIISDALDYLAAPLFSMPIIGDVFDVITLSCSLQHN